MTLKDHHRSASGAACVRATLAASFMFCCLACTACTFDIFYALHAIDGQAGILLGMVPIVEAVADPGAAPETRRKLEMIVDVRTYAGDVIGLVVDTSFTSYYDSNGLPLAHSVVAARRDALEPMLWEFPFFGVQSSLTYFDRGFADAKVAELEWWGYDAWQYELDAYSLAVLPNPVLSPMLARDDIDLVTIVFHELTHRTVGRSRRSDGDIIYNENVAEFVGRRAAIQYFTDRLAGADAMVNTAEGRFEDADVVAAFFVDFAGQLDAVYASSMSHEDKIAEKETLFEAARLRFAEQIRPMLNEPARHALIAGMPSNNAFVLLFLRYNEQLSLLDAVFEAAGRNLRTTLSVFGNAAIAEGDPFAYLEGWLAERR